MENVATLGANTGTAHVIPLDDPRVHHEDRVAVSTAFGEATAQWVSVNGVSVICATVQSPNRLIRYVWSCGGA